MRSHRHVLANVSPVIPCEWVRAFGGRNARLGSRATSRKGIETNSFALPVVKRLARGISMVVVIERVQNLAQQACRKTVA